MKVLHLLQSPHFSGAENVVCQIIGMMKKHKVIEMVYCSSDGEIREALRERNITFYPMSSLTCSEVRRVIKEVKPDIIHAHDMRASFVAALTCGKIKLISHIHNNAYDARGLSVKAIAYILAGIKAKRIFWVSQSSYDGYIFHKLFAKKSEILYNVMKMDDIVERASRDTEKYDYDVIYVGRLTYPKNPQRLISVLEKAIEECPSIKAAVAGNGDMMEEIQALVREKGLDKNIEFLGFVSNPLKIVRDSKVMLMTSRWEGTPMCALEAQCLGTPIVSTPTDGLVDIITDGVNGYLSDDDDKLADQLCQIVYDEALREQMSIQAKQKMAILMDEEKYAESIKSAYM